MKENSKTENKKPLIEPKKKMEEFSIEIPPEKDDKKLTSSTKAIIIIESIIFITFLSVVLLIVFLSGKESEMPLIDYKEAEKLVDPKVTGENHNLLDETFENISELISVCENINISEINITIDEIPESLNFLKNSTEIKLILIKEDLDLYMTAYANKSQEINTLTNKLSGIMKRISEPLSQYKKEIDNLTKDYEKNIQNLAMPIIINSNNSFKPENETYKKILTQYTKETKKLNQLYNNFFKQVKEDANNFTKSIKTIPEKIGVIMNKYNETISKSNEILANALNTSVKDIPKKLRSLTTTKMNIPEPIIEAAVFMLKSLKEAFISFHTELTTLKNELQSIVFEISKFADSFGKEESDFLGNLGNLALQLGKSTLNIVPIIANFFGIDSKNIIKTAKNIVTGKVSLNYAKVLGAVAVYFLDYWVSQQKLFNVETSTSLDLLFIVDITGSMEPYLDEVKDKMIKIIEGIIKGCPGIDINIGFIGYEDFYEKYYKIDFTKNHTYLEKYISKIKTEGGGSYYPDEDVALALDLALRSSWKSNAKLAVFIADAPGHGEKYGGHATSSYDPERREIDEMITQMAEESISLFCLNITSKTDKMFKVFKDIYNEKMPNNTLFEIIDNKNISFSDVVADFAIKIYLQQRKKKQESCLLDKETAVEILKSNYGIDNKNPDDNLRFILGKCSPVLLIPGIYSTKLKVELNCKGLASEEKDTTLKNIRLFCGNDVCKDESKTSEEHPLLFSILEDAFGLEITNAKKYGACLGHMATYFQNEKECPKVGNKNTCFYSKYVKVSFYGGTTHTLKESRCGVEGISNVVQTGDLTLDAVISLKATAANSFSTISKNLINQKYKEGFSLAALPNDYRRYLATNNFATEVFKSQINRLYKNTGKPVVIISHSFGTLVTLTNLLKNKNDKTFMKKIKKFVALAPPFAGSSELLNVFLHTSNFIDNDFTKYPEFGQYLIYKSLPTIMELRPQPMPAKIFTSKDYEELGNALRGRLEIERDCNEKKCTVSQIETKTKKFDDIFNGYFPSLLDSECEYEKFKSGANTLNRKCFTNIYNVGECPTIITKSVKPTKNDFNADLYCNKFGKEYFYQGECDNKERNCLDEMYFSNKCPNVYSNTNAVQFLIDRFNKNFANKFGNINKNYFDSYDTIKTGVKNSIEYQKKIDLIKELPIPPVDTELVYGSFYPTIAALILDDNDFTKDGEIFKKGGDNTVPAWSSLLTGLKWIYDKQKGNLSQNIKLIEYCSRIANFGKYKYDPTKEQNFGAIGCQCLNKDDNLYENNIDDCSHAGMLSDEYLFKYIYSVVNDPKENIVHTDTKKSAAKKYEKYYDYVGECNKDIYDILDTAK